jgi:starch phosphorylase
MGTYLGRDSRSIQKQIVNHIEYTLGLTRFNFKDFNAYQATAFSVRDRLIEQLNDANEYFDVSKRLLHLCVVTKRQESLLYVSRIPSRKNASEFAR